MNVLSPLQRFIKSCSNAVSGLQEVFKSERNFRIHAVAALLALLLGFLLKISDTHFLIIIICIGAVMACEILNSAIEKICDFIAPEKSEKIRVIKDISAAAVLLFSLASLVTGLVIFLPALAKMLFK